MKCPCKRRHELTAEQAGSRAQAMAAEAPYATRGNAAAHIAQLALQAVVERTRRQQSDPRMASLRSVNDLQQLWVGSRANYKWGGRQPLRRRRGDVHGDVSAVVLRLDWDGALLESVRRAPWFQPLLFMAVLSRKDAQQPRQRRATITL